MAREDLSYFENVSSSDQRACRKLSVDKHLLKDNKANFSKLRERHERQQSEADQNCSSEMKWQLQ